MLIISIILVCWLVVGFLAGIISVRYVNNEWPRRNAALLCTLGGVVTLFLGIIFCIIEFCERLDNSVWWNRRIFEKDPYEYHKYQPCTRRSNSSISSVR